MNYQKDSEDPRRQKVADILDTQPEYLSYYAWPQTFASTAGPFGGIGGQAISTFTIEAWTDLKDAVLFCGGKLWKKVEDFDPSLAVMGEYSDMRRRRKAVKSNSPIPPMPESPCPWNHVTGTILDYITDADGRVLAADLESEVAGHIVSCVNNSEKSQNTTT